MRTAILVISLLASTSLHISGQVLLNAGETFTYEFTHFDYQAHGLSGAKGRVGLNLQGFNGTDSLRFDAYEDSTSGAPIFTTNLIAGAGSTDFSFPNAWQDLQGVFRVTMLTGSATLQDFFGSVITSGNDLYSLKVTPQPEPRLATFLSGSGQIQISWPTNLTGYSLECTTNCAAPFWSSVTNNITNTTGRFSVTIDAKSGQCFYRLHRP